jgi:hypothetical protein
MADPIDLEVAIGAGRSETLSAPPGDAGTYALQCWTFTIGGIYRLMSAGPVAIPAD